MLTYPHPSDPEEYTDTAPIDGWCKSCGKEVTFGVPLCAGCVRDVRAGRQALLATVVGVALVIAAAWGWL